MFSIFRKKKADYRGKFSFIGTDIHSHLLPGIDDGSPDDATSFLLTEGLLELGFRQLITTPHIISDLYPNTPDTISTAYQALINSDNFPIQNQKFSYAAEYMVDFEFEEKSAKNPILCFGEAKCILIEMSYLVESPNIRQVIFNLLTKGYQPILAHPERYGYYHHIPDMYETLADAGCELQLNLLSLTGHYGKPTQAIAQKLIKQGLYQWVGTDIHHPRHLTMLQEMASNTKIIAELEQIQDLKNSQILL
jgi:protein-tyrosine phosphatase